MISVKFNGSLAESSVRFLLAFSLSLVTASFPQESYAVEDTFAAGVKQFGAKSYVPAAVNFKKAVTANPKNDSARYYYALSLHYGKDLPGAKKAYAELIRLYPDSNGANYARAALSTLDPALLKTLPPSRRPPAQYAVAPVASATPSGSGIQSYNQMPSESNGRSSSYDTLPDDCRIYYKLHNGCFEIDALVNGRPMKMYFDTGAEGCAFGRDHLTEVGITPPTGKPTGMAVGVGDGGEQATWEMPVDLKVGPIERRNFPIHIQKAMGVHPLLGQTFFQDFTYTIDNGAQSIHFVRKRKNTGSAYADPSKDPNAVPFTRMGKELLVKAEVNGKPTTFFFDTGASVVTLTQAQCRALGLTIPEDAQISTVQGIAGSSRARVFNVRTLRVGGLVKNDFEVWVPDSEMAGVGLLGQPFYNNYQYTIDYDRGYIHFLRR